MEQERSPTAGGDATESAPAPEEIIRSPAFRRLLLLSAVVGVVVSFACWAFLELVHLAQIFAFETGPEELGLDAAPFWWPLAVLGLAGLLIGLAVDRLPGHGGHVPADGLQAGSPTLPAELPGVLLAAFASIALGFVLGPEGPLIALATGLVLFAVRRARQEVPDETVSVLAAAASFAALATIFGSPIIGAVIIIEAAGLGGSTMRLVLLPGLMASGIGSLVFIGMGSLTGLSSAAYAISPLDLAPYPEPTLTAFFWAIGLAIVAAAFTFVIRWIGTTSLRLISGRTVPLTVLAGLLIGLIAVGFERLTGEPYTLVLLSGQEAMNGIVDQAASMSGLVLVMLILAKGLAWGLSLGAGRGGPTFPALFLGIVGGLLAGQLPGFAETPAIAALMGAMCVATLRLPLTAVVVALLVSQAGLAASPLVIVAVVAAYITTELLDSMAATDAPSDAPTDGPKAAEPA